MAFGNWGRGKHGDLSVSAINSGKSSLFNFGNGVPGSGGFGGGGYNNPSFRDQLKGSLANYFGRKVEEYGPAGLLHGPVIGHENGKRDTAVAKGQTAEARTYQNNAETKQNMTERQNEVNIAGNNFETKVAMEGIEGQAVSRYAGRMGELVPMLAARDEELVAAAKANGATGNITGASIRQNIYKELNEKYGLNGDQLQAVTSNAKGHTFAKLNNDPGLVAVTLKNAGISVSSEGARGAGDQQQEAGQNHGSSQVAKQQADSVKLAGVTGGNTPSSEQQNNPASERNGAISQDFWETASGVALSEY